MPSTLEKQSLQQSSALEQKFQLLSALFSFIGELQRMDSATHALHQICARLPELIDCKQIAIFLIDATSEQLELSASNVASAQEIEQLSKSTPARNCIDPCLAERQLVHRKCEHFEQFAFPIGQGWELLGVMYLRYQATQRQPEDLQAYLSVTADTLGHKLAMEQTIDALESSVSELSESQQRLNAYFRVAQLNDGPKQEQSFYRELHDIIREYINTESFFICLYDKDEDKLWLPYLHDRYFGEHFEHVIGSEDKQRSLVMQTLNQFKTCLYQHKQLKQLQADNKLVVLERLPYSWLSVPFRINEEIIGAITLQSYRRNLRFGANEEQFLSYLASHISNAISRKWQAQKLHHMALHDAATGLPNRALYVDRLEHALAKNARHKTRSAVLFIDLDNFKQVNDQFGHQAGDELLRQAAYRMQQELREEDTLARLGGDEFAIIIEPCDAKRVAINAASRILAALARPFVIDSHRLQISSSIGIAFNERGESADEILNHADHAMYHAKRSGKNRYQVFENNLYKQLQNSRQLSEELQRAIENNELSLYYQPILDLRQGKVLGLEALLRWHHPHKGLIPPCEFIETAERSELIDAIDQQLMRLAAQQVVSWRRRYNMPLYVCINISSQRFAQPRFVKELTSVIQEYQVPPGALVVEITEHLLMENFAAANQTMQKLREKGVMLSLDDFGTGYSSLSYLNRLSFDLIKIDRSFIKQINATEKDYPIISTIIALTRTLGMQVVAEGIESPQQLKRLKKLSCHLGQGYFIARPMPADQIDELLSNQHLFKHIADIH